MKTAKLLLFSILFFLLHKFIVFSVALWTYLKYFTGTPDLRYAVIIHAFEKWDSGWYIEIARSGYYSLQSTAFFPLFPITVRNVAYLLHTSNEFAGLVVDNVFLFGSIYYLLRLVTYDFDFRTAFRTVVFLIVFPVSFYLSCMYTESMFLFFTVTSFYAMRKRQFWAAGILGLFASLTRNSGILLLIPWAIEYLRYKEFKLSKFRWDVLSGLLIPLGLGIYMLKLKSRFGDPLSFAHVQAMWSREFHLPWDTLYYGTINAIYSPVSPWAKILHRFEPLTVYLSLLVMTVGQLARRMPLSYWLYGVVALLLPLTQPNMENAWFMSTPRFELVLFPLLILTVLWIRPRVLFYSVMFVSLLCSLYMQMKWTRGFFVS
ncbi:MAG: hypothetical protein JWN30_91 [Bacilli bacterium]|nr:hypothetical protein [Bacilli bacterium]